ncbi:MAG TPA: glutathione peroxidase [Flavobacteriaceae bacterium]|nr:glutathione peroxidase [Flavobacteriaceae bacterium]
MQDRPSIHKFKVEDINGNEFDFNTLKGKKVMIVNTASKCGLTPQYEELQKIFEQYQDKDFTIVGFPSNDFMSQEPGSNAEIAEFCRVNYGVTFPMMSKISVTGKDKHPIYQFLTEESKNGYADSKVEWNFQKYLLNEDGQLEKIIGPRVKPTDVEITDWIEKQKH